MFQFFNVLDHFIQNTIGQSSKTLVFVYKSSMKSLHHCFSAMLLFQQLLSPFLLSKMKYPFFQIFKVNITIVKYQIQGVNIEDSENNFSANLSFRPIVISANRNHSKPDVCQLTVLIKIENFRGHQFKIYILGQQIIYSPGKCVKILKNENLIFYFYPKG